jgi:hypothetical protein
LVWLAGAAALCAGFFIKNCARQVSIYLDADNEYAPGYKKQKITH